MLAAFMHQRRIRCDIAVENVADDDALDHRILLDLAGNPFDIADMEDLPLVLGYRVTLAPRFTFSRSRLY